MSEKLTVHYKVSEEVMKKEVVETGTFNNPGRTIQFDLESMEPDTRQKLFDVGAFEISSWGSLQTLADIKEVRTWDHDKNDEAKEVIHLDGEPTIDQVIEIMARKKAGEAEIKAIQKAKRDAEVALNEKLLSLYREECQRIFQMGDDLEALNAYQVPDEIKDADTRESRVHQNDLLSLRSEKIRELTTEKAEAEREAWAKEHGSDHLQKSIAEGFDCKKLYVLERAALEAPDFEVDYYDVARFDYVNCPSWDALMAKDQAKELNLGIPVIVNLTRPPDNSDNSDYPDDLDEPETAIMIEDFLNEYNLFKIVG